MAEGIAKSLKNEEDACDDVPLSAFSGAKMVKKEEPSNGAEDGEDQDNVPLSKSRVRKSKTSTSKVKKEEIFEQTNDKKIKKREEEKKNVKSVSRVKTSGTDDSENEDVKEKKEKKKRKRIKEVEKKTVGRKGSVADGKVKGRKVYDLPGQKHDQPEERDPLRIFYESLYNQVPGSEMAALWMMEWGLLPLDEAKKVYDNKLKKNQQQKLRSPIKAASVEMRQNGAKKLQKTVQKTEMKVSRQRKARDSQDEDDDDFVLSKIAKKPRASG
ncbi:nucleolar protein 58-like [Zingiber officinale]|uniref:nucleolar protein 58-like n=1 Tax=Zingiber officinale TaxID=94328 RepID=UPI001C4C2974|nr:nucleolar protein 58-like [Zingiber officinale]